MAYVHVFAGLMAEPTRLTQRRDFPITEEDFVDKFHKIIYASMYNMAINGVEKITSLEIITALNAHPTQKAIFDSNDGEEYLEALEEMGLPENFDYHFERVKKFTLLRRYAKQGIDFDDIYSTDPFLTAQQEIENNARFNGLSVHDMIKIIDSKIIDIKSDFTNEEEGYQGHVAENLKDILAQKKLAPSYGANVQSAYMNTATRGARKRKLYCLSGSSGSGKTRSGLANALGYSVPIIYDSKKGKWVKTGATGRTVFISTELEEEEIKIPAVCWIAEIDEEKVQENTLTEEEENRLAIAIEILSRTPFWVVEMFDFDVDDIEHTVQKYINKHDVDYVVFDYIHSTLKMFDSMAKKGAKNLQEHQLLRIMTIHLKNMCNRYDIHIDTFTQLNDGYKNEGNVAVTYDQSMLEGSKSIVNKLDLGAIQVPLTIKDEQLFEELKHDLNIPMGMEPTHTINIYKNRGNRWKFIRIWVNINLGTLRTTDLFVTNYKGHPVTMTPRKIKYMSADIESDLEGLEVLAMLDELTKREENVKIEKRQINDDVDVELQQELREAYEEMFEYDELPETIEQEIKELKGFGLDKKRKMETPMDW